MFHYSCLLTYLLITFFSLLCFLSHLISPPFLFTLRRRDAFQLFFPISLPSFLHTRYPFSHFLLSNSILSRFLTHSNVHAHLVLSVSDLSSALFFSFFSFFLTVFSCSLYSLDIAICSSYERACLDEYLFSFFFFSFLFWNTQQTKFSSSSLFIYSFFLFSFF